MRIVTDVAIYINWVKNFEFGEIQILNFCLSDKANIHAQRFCTIYYKSNLGYV